METTIKWLGTPESRIISIRRFREYLNTLDIQEAVKQTMKNWEAGPYLRSSQLSLNDIDSFPSPWELFSQPFYCSNSRILGAFYTLVMSEHGKNNNIRIVVSNDVIAGEIATIIFDEISSLNTHEKSTIIDRLALKNALGE